MDASDVIDWLLLCFIYHTFKQTQCLNKLLNQIDYTIIFMNKFGEKTHIYIILIVFCEA